MKTETLAEGEKAVRRFRGQKQSTDLAAKPDRICGELKSIANLVTLLISAIAAISLGVAGLGIINTMISNTVERRKEIGICMAVGAKRRDISICFLTEAVIISCAGGTVGAIAGAGLFFIITRLLGTAFMISPVKILVAEAVSVICGVVFSVIPARRASRLDPIEALRNGQNKSKSSLIVTYHNFPEQNRGTGALQTLV